MEINTLNDLLLFEYIDKNFLIKTLSSTENCHLVNLGRFCSTYRALDINFGRLSRSSWLENKLFLRSKNVILHFGLYLFKLYCNSMKIFMKYNIYPCMIIVYKRLTWVEHTWKISRVFVGYNLVHAIFEKTIVRILVAGYNLCICLEYYYYYYYYYIVENT